MRHLRSAIEQHCAIRDWVCSCKCFQRPKDILAEDITSAQVVFLDIDMPEVNGLEVARHLRSKYSDLIIVFVTGFIEYAPAGYNVNAFRYLLKPELKRFLPACMDDIWKKLYICQDSIRFQQLDHAIKVRLSDILYIEGTPHRHILLHTLTSPHESIECLGSLSEYEAKLVGKGFLRIQKSFLANMGHIEDIRNYVAVMDNGESLRVSRANYSQICKEYILWEGQHL